MKGFIFGLLVGAVGAIAGLHYTDEAHVAKIHAIVGIEDEAADDAAMADDTMDDAVEVADDAMDDAAEAVDDAVEEAADDAAEMVDDAMDDAAAADDDDES